jgi:hypothetical protein
METDETFSSRSQPGSDAGPVARAAGQHGAMVEKVARAITKARFVEPDRIVYTGIPFPVGANAYSPCSDPLPAWTLATPEARAAIEAMRGLTDAMLRAGRARHAMVLTSADEIYQAMIDAALNPEGGNTHASDCAANNAPALPPGPCDCGSGA